VIPILITSEVVMNWFKAIFDWLGRYFASGQAKKDAKLALEHVGKALPYIKIAGDIVIGLTPTQLDDIVWAGIKAKFPDLLDGNKKSPDEVKLAALAIATELLRKQFPELSVSVARAATQLAYLEYRAQAQA
jgi:hypothetical protein